MHLLNHEKKSLLKEITELNNKINNLKNEKNNKALQLELDNKNSAYGNIQLEILKLSVNDPTPEKLHEIKNKLYYLLALLDTEVKPNLAVNAIKHLELEANRPDGIPLSERWGPKDIEFKIGLPSVLGAYSGIGKSRTSLNFCYDCIMTNRKVLFFSLEMTPGQLIANLIAIAKTIEKQNNGSSNSPYFTKKILNSVKENNINDFTPLLKTINEYLTVIDATGFTTSNIITAYDQFVPQNGVPELVIIDYLQKIRAEKNSLSNDRRVQVIEIIELLTDIAKRSNSAWLWISQINRQSATDKNGAPAISGFQESASIEQNAALTMTIGRRKEHGPEIIEMWIEKNRFGRYDKFDLVLDPPSGAILYSKEINKETKEKNISQTDNTIKKYKQNSIKF
jgi:hypothetical protein